MKNFVLNDGNIIPAIGFGTYKNLDDQGIDAIKLAIKNGYRLIDTAAKYDNEEEVGIAIQQSEIKREELFITSKVWREELGFESTLKAFETSLKKLQLNYLDLYLIHWPANKKNYENWEKANAETWQAMEKLQSEGKIKSIGVSNFWPEHLDALFQTANKIPAINQIEFHPGYTQQNVVEFCREKNIHLQAWSPLARGKVFENDLLNSFAKKYNKNVAQICLKWIVQSGLIPIPKASSEKRIKENIDIFDFELSSDDMIQINELPKMGFSGELPNEWPDRVF